MKKLLAIIALLFTMGACSALPKGLVQSDSEGTALPTQGLATETPVPTATIGYYATAHTALTAERASALTAESANLAVAEYTADAMAMELDRARITEAAGILSALGTSQAINATGTAAPMVATQKAEAIAYDIAKQTEVAHVPTQIYAEEQARLFVQNGERDANINFGIRLAAICMGVAFAIYLLAVAFATAIKAGNPAPVEQVRNLNDEEKQFQPIPMVADPRNPNTTHRAEINCTKEQLQELADGILNKRMTLAFNQWTGTPVYKNLKDIREFMQYHKPPMAKVLAGKNGELSIEAIGEDFLLECLNGLPPKPYVCLLPSPTR